MRAVQLASPQSLKHIDIEEPKKPGPGEALVQTHRVGVCGTDVSAYLGKFPFFDYPRIPGHELGVEVLAVGAEVGNVKPGDRCSVEPYLNCGRCYACRNGKGNCCERLNVIGVMVDGGLCERLLIPANKLHRSLRLSFEQLALVETLAIGCHAVARGTPKEGSHALIIGVGPIGLAALEFTRLAGAEITVMDMVSDRLDFCRRTYGVDHAVLFSGDGSEVEKMREITGGDMYAVVTDATGSPRSMSGALEYVAHGGTLVYLGVTREEIIFPQPAMHRREMSILGSRNALPSDFTHIIKLIEEGMIDTQPWVTHRTSLDAVVDQFESFTRSETGVVKAIIEVAP